MMFWGLVLEPGKRYSTTVEKSFHVSNAALDCSSLRNDNEIISVVLETEGSQILLCNLCKQKGVLQENLDLNFMSGDRLTFECRGHGRIHLSGYLLPDEDDDMSGMLGDEESEEEEEEESEWPATANAEKPKKEKRSNETPPDVPSKKKKIKSEPEESESEEDDSDYLEGLEDQDDDGDDDDEDEDDEGSDRDEDEESEEEEENKINQSHKEKQKQQKQEKSKTPNKQNLATPKKTPVTNGLSPKDQKLNKKSPGGDKTPSTNATPKQKQVLDQGVVIKEIKVGSGAPAKLGKTVIVHYLGKLKENNKVFDKQLKGEGFKFKLGRGEVIKGWDIGVQGMKVGGKRIVHCPPDVAYGAKGVPPKIPPNSALIFEVELKNVY